MVVPMLNLKGTGIVSLPVPAVGGLIVQPRIIFAGAVQLSEYTGAGSETVAKVMPGSAIILVSLGHVITGAVVSMILLVAGDSLHPEIVLAVPAGIFPQAVLVTYRVFTL